MKVIGVIPSRYNSSRFPGKPLSDICGKPMIWWVYNQALKVRELDNLVVATDDQRIVEVCESLNMKCIITSHIHDTPTSRLYEVSKIFDADYYVFIGGDEPLIEPDAISKVVEETKTGVADVYNAMTRIKTSPEVIDFTNIKVVCNAESYLMYTSRSPLPYPKGGLDFEYMKFVGIGAFSNEALSLYNDTPKSKLERIEECDLLRFIEQDMPVKMVEVVCRNVSVDTPKDLEFVCELIKKEHIEKE